MLGVETFAEAPVPPASRPAAPISQSCSSCRIRSESTFRWSAQTPSAARQQTARIAAARDMLFMCCRGLKGFFWLKDESPSQSGRLPSVREAFPIQPHPNHMRSDRQGGSTDRRTVPKSSQPRVLQPSPHPQGKTNRPFPAKNSPLPEWCRGKNHRAHGTHRSPGGKALGSAGILPARARGASAAATGRRGFWNTEKAEETEAPQSKSAAGRTALPVEGPRGATGRARGTAQWVAMISPAARKACAPGRRQHRPAARGGVRGCGEALTKRQATPESRRAAFHPTRVPESSRNLADLRRMADA